MYVRILCYGRCCGQAIHIHIPPKSRSTKGCPIACRLHAMAHRILHGPPSQTIPILLLGLQRSLTMQEALRGKYEIFVHQKEQRMYTTHAELSKLITSRIHKKGFMDCIQEKYQNGLWRNKLICRTLEAPGQASAADGLVVILSQV